MQANLLLAQGRYEEARAVAAEAQRILKLSMPDDSWQAAAARGGYTATRPGTARDGHGLRSQQRVRAHPAR